MKKLSYLVYPAVVAFSLVAAATAHAAPGSGYEADPPQKIVSLKTRAQVLVELQQARADGTIAQFNEGWQPTPVTRSTLTRAAVRADAAAARAAGYDAQYREGNDALYVAQQRPVAGRSLATAPAKSAQ